MPSDKLSIGSEGDPSLYLDFLKILSHSPNLPQSNMEDVIENDDKRLKALGVQREVRINMSCPDRDVY